VSEKVADGEIELGILVIPNILSVPGAELVGPIPDEVNSYIVFTAGVSAASPNQAAAREMIRLVTGPVGIRAIRAKGMDPGLSRIDRAAEKPITRADSSASSAIPLRRGPGAEYALSAGSNGYVA
jgi:hypothetical protein